MSDNAIPQDGSQVEDVPLSEETDDDILKEARERYRDSTDNNDNLNNARDDLLFLSGGLNQWDAESARLRTAERRPCLTINNLPTFLHKVTNEQRQNTPAINVHPVDENADKDTAEVITGLIRHIQYISNADVALDTAVNSAAAIGFGYFRVMPCYDDEGSFDQSLEFKRIRNTLAVHFDPLSTEVDGSDCSYCFIDCIESRTEFKRKYPDSDANNTDLIGKEMYRGWFTDSTVLVTEYYRVKCTEATLCELQDGAIGWKDELPKEFHDMIKRERKSEKRVVQWFKMTGSDILERTEIKCKWIPVFPVYGDEIDIDGKVIRSGIIRNAKDPFKMYNLWITLATEEVALRPKTPFIGAVGQFETAKNQWENANNRSYAFIEYDPVTVDGQIAPAPSRQPMADVPSGMLAMAMHAADNKKATTGLFDASLGARGSATSGIQEREQQNQGEISNFHYADNRNHTMAHAGRCIVDMIPHYYDASRVVRILGEDNTAKQVPINTPYQRPGKLGAVETVMHNLTVGRYDITVNAGPSYTSKRQEAAEFMTSAMQAAKDPQTANVLTYLAIKNQDVAGADEATKMLKKLLPPNLVEPDENEQGEPMVQTPHGPIPVSQVPQLIQQMGQALQNADKAVNQAEIDKQAITKAELDIKRQAEETRAFEAETKRLQMQRDAEVEKSKALAETARLEAERVATIAKEIEAERKAQADAEREAMEPEEVMPTADDVAKIVIANMPQPDPMPKSLTVKAPSGQVYEVSIH